MVHKTGPDCGQALVLLDGEPLRQIDSYAPRVNWNTRIVLVENLPPGAHKITIVALGTHQEKSSDAYVQIVNFE